jgi:hypothetical protein
MERRQGVKHSILRNLHLRARATAGTSLRRLAVATEKAARAETHVFKDVLRPGGVERSAAQKAADGRACGMRADGTFTNVPAFERCMRKHG